MEYGILPSLTRDYIFSKITQEQIFEYYLQINVKTDTLFKAPNILRPNDNNPTCSFYYSNNGKLRLRDWAGYFWGDCFDIVAFILRVKADDKKSFNIILDQIARDFRIHKYSNKDFIHTGNTFDIREVLKKKSKSVSIQFQPRNWYKQDADFWLAGNINSKLLEKGRVFPCMYIWLNSQPVYNFLPKDPAYAYFFNQKEIKIYYPEREKYRFLSNSSYLQGIDLLESDEIGIITKSYKDVLSLKSFGIQAVSPSSETTPLSNADWLRIKHTCNHWYSLFDYDRTGILMACKLRKLYNITPLFFYNQKPINKHLLFTGSKTITNFENFINVKDFYDYVKLYGKTSTINLINKVKDNINFDEYNLELYNNLYWLQKDKIINTEKYDEIPF